MVIISQTHIALLWSEICKTESDFCTHSDVSSNARPATVRGPVPPDLRRTPYIRGSENKPFPKVNRAREERKPGRPEGCPGPPQDVAAVHTSRSDPCQRRNRPTACGRPPGRSAPGACNGCTPCPPTGRPGDGRWPSP